MIEPVNETEPAPACVEHVDDKRDTLTLRFDGDFPPPAKVGDRVRIVRVER